MKARNESEYNSDLRAIATAFLLITSAIVGPFGLMSIYLYLSRISYWQADGLFLVLNVGVGVFLLSRAMPNLTWIKVMASLFYGLFLFGALFSVVYFSSALYSGNGSNDDNIFAETTAPTPRAPSSPQQACRHVPREKPDAADGPSGNCIVFSN